MDLAGFIAARLDDDVEYAHTVKQFDERRMLREVAAKRAILAEHAIYEPGQYAGYPQFWSCSACGAAGYGESYEVGWPCPTVRHLAAVWSDHPGYRDEWKP